MPKKSFATLGFYSDYVHIKETVRQILQEILKNFVTFKLLKELERKRAIRPKYDLWSLGKNDSLTPKIVPENTKERYLAKIFYQQYPSSKEIWQKLDIKSIFFFLKKFVTILFFSFSFLSLFWSVVCSPVKT